MITFLIDSYRFRPISHSISAYHLYLLHSCFYLPKIFISTHDTLSQTHYILLLISVSIFVNMFQKLSYHPKFQSYQQR